jgi:hypothetical protein
MRKSALLFAAIVLLAGISYTGATPDPVTPFTVAMDPQFSGYRLYSGVGNYQPFGRTLASDASVIGLIRYTGLEDSGTVDLNAGTLELFDGDLASEAVDTDADDGGCDVEDQGDLANAACGVATGIDLAANAACDTWGEVADIINGTKFWQFVLIDTPRDERVIATGASLIDPADAQAKGPAGLQMLYDVSESDSHNLALIPGEGRNVAGNDVYSNIEVWLTDPNKTDTDSTTSEPYEAGPFSGVRTFLTYWSYSYDDGDNDDTVANVVCQDMTGAEAQRDMFIYVAAADDTTYNKDWTAMPLGCRVGEKMILQIYSTNTAAAANTFTYATGFFVDAR